MQIGLKLKSKLVKVLFFSVLFFLAPLSIKANVNRQDLIEYNLDYYERQKKTLQEQKEARDKNEAALLDKQKASADFWKKRSDRIKKFLDSMLYTFTYTAKYSDNLGNTNGGQEKDTSTLATLGVNYVPSSSSRRKQSKTDVFFDYEGKGLFMSTGAEGKTNVHSVRFGVDQDLTDNYSLNANYQGTNQKIVTSSGENKEYSYNVNQTYRAGFNADWTRFPWSFNYSYNRSRHEKAFKASDTNTTIFDINGSFKISAKTDLLCEYTMGEVEYPHAKENDNTYEMFNFGLRGKIAPKVIGIAKLSWGTYKYLMSDSEVEERAFTLNYRPLSRLMMSFALNSRIRASTFGTTDASEQLSMGLRLRYLPPFNKRLTLNSKIVSSTTTMEDSNRSDDSWSLDLGADYGLNRWMKLSLNYVYDNVDSNIQLNDYEKNVISLTGTVEF